MTNTLRIIFMGTPEFAVASLAALAGNNNEIVAVVTAPDKPAGRGLKVQESAVKKYAVAHQIPVLQPVKLRDPEFIETLKRYQADLQVVVAFRMLPEMVWNMPPLGTINLHASLLPQYRGAAPVNRVIMNGETETGLTTFKLQHEIDTGQIIDQQRVGIGPDETAGQLHDKLMRTGAQLLAYSVKKIKEDEVNYIPQSELAHTTPLKTAPKIFKEDCKIHWNMEVHAIYNLIRGLNPYPAAWTPFNGKTMKVFAVEKQIGNEDQEPGTVFTDYKTFLSIACKGGRISLKEIQPSGKKKMKIADFLRGYREKELKFTTGQ